MNKSAEPGQWPWLPSLAVYGPDGHLMRQVAEQGKARAEQVKALGDKMPEALLGLGLLGAGVGLTGTKLYNLISRFNTPKEKYKKFGPGPKALDADEKIAQDWVKAVSDTIASGVDSVRKAIPAPPDINAMTQEQQGFFIPAALATTGLGLYGGSALARALENKRKKDEIEDMVDEARKDYQRALTGKRAEALDVAFSRYEQQGAQNTTVKRATNLTTPVSYAWSLLTNPLKAIHAYPLYTSALFGTGALAGKMTYDWTRERSKDKAIERARRSRARMEEAAPLYVDPAQLEAIKALHQKEIDKIKAQEIA